MPLPVSPSLPLPGLTQQPLPIAQPVPLPTPLPLATPLPAPGLTPPAPPSVESGQQCETPDETKRRREKKREDCRKLVRIKVKAHFRKVCLSEAIEHEAKRYRKKLVRKYITKPAGQLGKAAANWILKETGLTPYADQAKDIKKRVSDLTKKQKRYRVEVPGTHISFDPVDLIPKGKP